jgi:hypothetical protein
MGGNLTGGASGEATKREIVESRLITGALISSVGVGVLLMVLATLQAKWFDDSAPPFSPFLIVIPVALAVAAFYWLVNLAPPWKFFMRRPQAAAEGAGMRPRPPALRLLLFRGFVTAWVTALICIAISALAFGELSRAARTPASLDRYVLSLPMITGSSGNLTAPQSPTVQKSQDAVLVWWVTRQHHELPAGTLPTFLGGLFIITFGLWFPHIVLSQATGAMGLGEKLVAPILGLALVGLGATQQADAAKVEQDVQLVKGGYPAVLGLTPGQKQIKLAMADQPSKPGGDDSDWPRAPDSSKPPSVSGQGGSTYLLNLQGLSPDSISNLESQLARVSDDLEKSNSSAGASAKALADVSAQLQSALRDIENKTRNPLTADDITNLKAKLISLDSNVADLERSAQSNLQTLADTHRTDCVLLVAEGRDLNLLNSTLLDNAKAQDKARHDFFAIPPWQRMFRRAPPGGNADRLQAEQLRLPVEKIQRKSDALQCGATVQSE